MNSYYKLLYAGITHVLHVRDALGKAAMMKMGPNDMSWVVWAIGKFFFLFFHDFLLLTTVCRYYLCSGGTRWVREGGDDENRPKRHILRRLGHR